MNANQSDLVKHVILRHLAAARLSEAQVVVVPEEDRRYGHRFQVYFISPEFSPMTRSQRATHLYTRLLKAPEWLAMPEEERDDQWLHLERLMSLLEPMTPDEFKALGWKELPEPLPPPMDTLSEAA